MTGTKILLVGSCLMSSGLSTAAQIDPVELGGKLPALGVAGILGVVAVVAVIGIFKKDGQQRKDSMESTKALQRNADSNEKVCQLLVEVKGTNIAVQNAVEHATEWCRRSHEN